MLYGTGYYFQILESQWTVSLIRADKELYMDPFLDINGVKSNYKVTIKEGDSVCAVCKVSSKEISPKTIRIYFIFRL